MKFRDPATAETYDIIENARKAYCRNRPYSECYNCKLNMVNNEEHKPCDQFVYDNPAYSARLMGYEIIEDETMNEKTEKPLKDWTLGEVKEFCLQRTNNEKSDSKDSCFECRFNNICSVWPGRWELKENRRLTPEELEICKAVGAKWVSRDSESDGFVYCHTGGKVERINGVTVGEVVLCGIDRSLFPSVKPGDLICVKEVTGDA